MGSVYQKGFHNGGPKSFGGAYPEVGGQRWMKRRFLLVGLAGGIGTGKSAVSRMLRDLGYLIIDADLIARDVRGARQVGLREDRGASR